MKIQSRTSPETESLIQAFLTTHHSGVLATADLMGNPHAAIVYYDSHSNYSIAFATKKETQKYKNIVENSQVAFVIYDEVAQTSLQITGRAKSVKDEEEGRHIVNAMFQQSARISHREFPPAEKLYAGDYVAFTISPSMIRMAIYARPDSEGDDLYETLLFSH